MFKTIVFRGVVPFRIEFLVFIWRKMICRFMFVFFV